MRFRKPITPGTKNGTWSACLSSEAVANEYGVLKRRKVMIGTCKNCGCTESDALADAKTLGLQEEFQRGIYTCCQLAQWSQEQWASWFEATHDQDPRDISQEVSESEASDAEAVLVPVRFRRSVPWF